MEIPFYETIREFKDYYLEDFKPSEITKLKYLNRFKKIYEDFYNSELTKIYNFKTADFERELSEISKLDYRIDIEIIDKYIDNDFPEFLKDGYFGIIQNYLSVYVSDEELIERYCTAYYNNEMERSNKRAGLIKYEKIIEFIKSEIELEKKILERFQPQQTTAPELGNPELDFSDNSDKVKLIMLEKLGIIEYIKTIQTKPNTISHTSEILSAITGIETKTLNTYLYPMLRPYRDDEDKNSPYKNPENLEKAERELIKLKIKNTNANR